MLDDTVCSLGEARLMTTSELDNSTNVLVKNSINESQSYWVEQ